MEGTKGDSDLENKNSIANDILPELKNFFISKKVNIVNFDSKRVDSETSNISFENNGMTYEFSIVKTSKSYLLGCDSSNGLSLFQSDVKEELDFQGFKEKEGRGANYLEFELISGVDVHPSVILGPLIEAFNKSLTYNTTNQSFQSQLEEMFPNADYGELEKIVSQLEDFEQTSKVTDSTKTGVVMDFILDGKKYFLKATSDIATIQREARYLDDSSQFQYLRAITPVKKGTLTSEGLEAIITHDVRDNISLRSNDLHVYAQRLKEEVEKVASKLKLNPEKMLQNPIVTDMFNRALEHTYMRDLVNQEQYCVEDSPMIESALLKERLASSSLDKELLKEIEDNFSQYEAMNGDVIQIHQKGNLIANYDPRSENIIYLGNNNRPLCDFGTVRTGHEAFDLRFEHGFDPVYVKIYAHFRNSLEQAREKNFEFSQKDISTLTSQVKLVNYASAVKLSAFKASKDLKYDTLKYLKMSRDYS